MKIIQLTDDSHPVAYDNSCCDFCGELGSYKEYAYYKLGDASFRGYTWSILMLCSDKCLNCWMLAHV